MKKIGLFSVACLLSGSVLADEINVSPETRQDLYLTIYNQNRALVSDVRTAYVPQGKSSLVFSSVSDFLIPESVFVKLPDAKILEQNFNYDVLSMNTLVQKSEGKEVGLLRTNPATGQQVLSKAVLLSSQNGYNPVLKIGDRIEPDFDGKLVFFSIPENLRDKPTLEIQTQAQTASDRTIEVNYLTEGLSWKADYVAQLQTDDSQMALNGFVTLTNDSATDFNQAKIQLISGDVNLVQQNEGYNKPYLLKASVANLGMSMDSAAGESMPVESLSDYYLYTLEEKTDLLSRQKKQVSLFSEISVPVEKSYEYENLVTVNNSSRDFETKDRKPMTLLKFKNTKAEGLGFALPAGTIRVYKTNQEKQMVFVGEDKMNPIAQNHDVKVKLGEAFDIFAKAKRTSFTSLGKTAYEASYEMTLQNSKAQEAQVKIIQSIPYSWKITEESTPSVKESSNQVSWTVTLPPQKEVKVTFKVQVRFE
jgi:hypothetical protein